MQNNHEIPISQAKKNFARTLNTSPLTKQYILPFQDNQKGDRTNVLHQPGHNIVSRKAPNITFNNTPNQSIHKNQAESLSKTINVKSHKNQISNQIQLIKQTGYGKQSAILIKCQQIVNNSGNTISVGNRNIAQQRNLNKPLQIERKSYQKNMQLDFDRRGYAYQAKQGHLNYHNVTPATQKTSIINETQKGFTPHHSHAVSDFNQQNNNSISTVGQTPTKNQNKSLSKKVSFRQLNQKQKYLKPHSHNIKNKQNQQLEDFKLFNNYINYEAADIIYQSPNRKYSYHTIQHPTIEYKVLDQSTHSMKINKHKNQQISNKHKHYQNKARQQVSNHVYVQNNYKEIDNCRNQQEETSKTPANQFKNMEREKYFNKEQNSELKRERSFTYFNKNATPTKNSVLQPARNRQVRFNSVIPHPKIEPKIAPQIQISQQDRKWIRQFPQPQYQYFEQNRGIRINRNLSADNLLKRDQKQKDTQNIANEDQKVGDQINELSNTLNNIETRLSNQRNCSQQKYVRNQLSKKTPNMNENKQFEKNIMLNKQSERQKHMKYHPSQNNQSQGIVYSFSSSQSAFLSGDQRNSPNHNLNFTNLSRENNYEIRKHVVPREKPVRKYRIIQQRQKIAIINQSRVTQEMFIKADTQGTQLRSQRHASSGPIVNKTSLTEFNAMIQKNQRQSISRNQPQSTKFVQQLKIAQKNRSHQLLEEMITSVEQPEFIKKLSASNQKLHHIESRNMHNQASQSIANSPKDLDMKIFYYQDTIFDCFSGNVQLTPHHQIARFHFLQSLQLINLPILSKYQHLQNQKFRSGQGLQKRRKILQPKKKFTLVFDLDETLIHCTHSLDVPYQYSIPIKLPNGTTAQTGINIRPYALPCLTELSKYFQLMIYTASHQLYADSIINTLLDSQGVVFSHKFYRDDCIKVQEGQFNLNFYMKDLRVIDRDMQNMILIDNAAYSYYLQLDNGVPMVPFFNNTDDKQLKELTMYLKVLLKTTQKEGVSLREANKKAMRLDRYRNQSYGFQTMDYNNPNNIKRAIKQIYQN